jgi:hypothetical protein
MTVYIVYEKPTRSATGNPDGSWNHNQHTTYRVGELEIIGVYKDAMDAAKAQSCCRHGITKKMEVV